MDPTFDTPAERDLKLARPSFAFLLDEMTNGVADLEPLDALLVLAINQANIAPLTRDREARARYGQLEAPAPDDERRPVSINAIAGSLGLPFETVRRRIRRLAGSEVCAQSSDGVVVPASFLSSGPYLQSVLRGHERLRRFYCDLAAEGLIGKLPAPAYGLEDSIPVRAAARLLADYVLRTSEGLAREAGNVISQLVLVALLASGLSPNPRTRTLSARAIAQKLSLPAETVRRHIADLADRSLCARTGSGWTLPQETLSRPGLQALFAHNAAHVQRLMTGLAERGVILAWEADANAGRATA